MTITIDGSGLTIEKLVRIARHGEKVTLHPDALERIKVCRGMLEQKLRATGIEVVVIEGGVDDGVAVTL